MPSPTDVYSHLALVDALVDMSTADEPAPADTSARSALVHTAEIDAAVLASGEGT